MTSDDFDTGNKERFTDQSMQEAEAQVSRKETGKPPVKKRKQIPTGVYLAVLLALLIVVIVFSCSQMHSINNPPMPSVEEATDGINTNFFLVCSKIEQYRLQHDRLPVSLDQVFVEDENLSYSITGEIYTLQYVYEDTVITWNSTQEQTDLISNEFAEMIMGEEVRKIEE